jgi:dienelactone hydrolase
MISDDLEARRAFLKQSGLAALALSTSSFDAVSAADTFHAIQAPMIDNKQISLIGPYGSWAASLIESKLPSLSFRNEKFTDIESWRRQAKARVWERLAMPDTGGTPKVTVEKTYEYDGLEIESLTWQLPYGPPTKGILLKPLHAKGKLPGILAFHDHGGNKYFGHRKITKLPDAQHPMMEEHQRLYYSGFAWANEIAKRGYVVLVSDAFPFESRRVLFSQVPESIRGNHSDADPERQENIDAYNDWAGNHEHIMAKSLFCAGTSWASVFLAEDQRALDVLCARPDVDSNRIGCGGLSGGGMRTVFMGGLDDRIKCSVCVGFMTTWKDLILHKSHTHTWMTYVPLLPNELDFPELYALRAPLPTMVLNDSEDELYTLPEMKRADQIIAEVFKKAGASDKYQCSYYPGPHKFDKDMQQEAFKWFDRWLK